MKISPSSLPAQNRPRNSFLIKKCFTFLKIVCFCLSSMSNTATHLQKGRQVNDLTIYMELLMSITITFEIMAYLLQKVKWVDMAGKK